MAGFLDVHDSLEEDLNLQYLQVEMARMDAYVRRAVRYWQKAGQDPFEPFRGLSLSITNAVEIAGQPFASCWGQMTEVSEEEEQAFDWRMIELQNQAEEIVTKATTEGLVLRLISVKQMFQLNALEYDLLLLCLAPDIDLRFERLFAFLQDDVSRKHPSLDLALKIFRKQGLERLNLLASFTNRNPLFANQCIGFVDESGAPGILGRPLQIEGTLACWLLGQYQPCEEISGFVRLIAPQAGRADGLFAHLDGNLVEESRRPGAAEKNEPIFVFYGPDQEGRSAAGRQIAAKLARFLLHIDVVKLMRVRHLAPSDALRMALRDARMTGALPYLDGWDACLDAGRFEEDAVQRVSAPMTRQELLAILLETPGLFIIAGDKAWQVAGIERERPVYFIEFPSPIFSQRRALWEHYLQQVFPLLADDPMNRTALAGQFSLSGGQIRDAIFSARDLALQEHRPAEMADLFRAARNHSSASLGGLARKIEPRYGWQDIILPADQLSLLREIVSTVRGRPQVLEQWGVGEKLVASAGIPILFSGSPGTGKTMVAEVIANELKLDLYKIELSTVISKYIGETEKNLESIFNEAEASNAILFFDEADAIFGKRSEVKDAHDRYANIEISYLLQRMERYNGVTILATNLRANLDEAFTRRLQFSVDFPFPDEEQRLHIWMTLMPENLPREIDLNLEMFARRFKLAGGNIRNIIVNAAYQAAVDGGRVTNAHLLHGARRELQKMGRLINEADMVV